MRNMFWGCESLETLDVSNFDVPDDTRVSGMFVRTSRLHGTRLPAHGPINRDNGDVLTRGHL